MTSWEREKQGGMSEEDKEWCRGILFMFKDKGDPTRSTGWDRAKCGRLMPAFLVAWDAYVNAEEAVGRIAESYDAEVC